MNLRALRRDQAARLGPELFLYERAFADCLERLALVRRRFQSALILGCPDRAWPDRLREFVPEVEVADPGAQFAARSGGRQVVEDVWEPEPSRYDLCIAVGTLDSVNDLPRALLALRFALMPDGLLLGAVAGGDSLPRLRAAMRAADEVSGAASPHVHPRIDPPALAGLLSAAGFAMPVVDVDRVQVFYSTFGRLVGDLRRMGATNILDQRSRIPLGRAARAAAAEAFASTGDATIETFELLHFAGWTPRESGAI
ncbi:MAG: methyltransferase domain-containing protein [Sphingomicrobium sp.]